MKNLRKAVGALSAVYSGLSLIQLPEVLAAWNVKLSWLSAWMPSSTPRYLMWILLFVGLILMVFPEPMGRVVQMLLGQQQRAFIECQGNICYRIRTNREKITHMDYYPCCPEHGVEFVCQPSKVRWQPSLLVCAIQGCSRQLEGTEEQMAQWRQAIRNIVVARIQG